MNPKETLKKPCKTHMKVYKVKYLCGVAPVLRATLQLFTMAHICSLAWKFLKWGYPGYPPSSRHGWPCYTMLYVLKPYLKPIVTWESSILRTPQDESAPSALCVLLNGTVNGTIGHSLPRRRGILAIHHRMIVRLIDIPRLMMMSGYKWDIKYDHSC